MSFSIGLKSQCTTPNILAWFKYDKNSNKWADKGGDNLDLKGVKDCGELSNPDTSNYYSVNFNRGMAFNQIGLSVKNEIKLKDNRSTNITIMAVLIPHDVDYDSKQWGLEIPYIGENRKLFKSYMEEKTPFLPFNSFDYGDTEGSNLYTVGLPDIEKDKFGKIVTYQTILRPDRTLTSYDIINEIINIYTYGSVPEIIVFDNLLDEDNRLRAETYLAIKYGISKELDYLSCGSDIVWNSDNGSNYNLRKTGISNESGWLLVQSRSTSYYDDEISGDPLSSSGRFEDYNTVQDYSHHENRLLTIGIEDESSNIKDRWTAPSYHVWGSNSNNVSYFNSGEYITINRAWRMETHNFGGDDIIPQIQWCNYLNMKNENGYFQKNNNDSNLDGICASSLGLETCKEGEFTFSVSNANLGNNSIVGFSSDNMEFVLKPDEDDLNPVPVGEYNGYIYAIKFGNGSVSVVWDYNGDGYYDHETSLGNGTSTYRIKFKRSDDGNYEFSVNGTAVFHSNYPCHGKGGVFAKMNLRSPVFGVNVLGGKGFKKANQKGTNVEFSYQRIKNEVFDGVDMIKEGFVPVLLINRNSSGTFDAGSAEAIRGDYSVTPMGYGDKVEFVDIEWSNNNSDLFSLGFVKYCNDQKDVTINVDECCDIMNVSFVAKSCSDSEPIFYQLYDADGNVVLYGCANTDEEVELGVLPEGDYELKIYYKGCEVFTKDFTLELTMSLPDNLIAEEVVALDANGEAELIIDENFFPDGFFDNVNTDNIEIIWTTPSGEVIIEGYPDGMTFTATETGTYTVEFKLYCDDGSYCSTTDSVLVTGPCDHTVESETSQCCFCNYLELTVTSDCSEDYLEGAYVTVYNENGNEICSMDLTGMETQVPLCEIIGQISYVVTFGDGAEVEGEEYMEEYLWQEIDLIEQEDGKCDTIKRDCAYYDISDKMTKLGPGWTIPEWKKIDPEPTGVIGYGNSICIYLPGTYTVKTNRRCSGGIEVCNEYTGEENGCHIIDTFCVVLPEQDCGRFDIDFNCDNILAEPETTCPSDPFCYIYAMEGCEPTGWQIIDSYGNIFYGTFDSNNSSVIPDNAVPGNARITVYFDSRTCPCSIYTEDFIIAKCGNHRKGLISGEYCENNPVSIDTTLQNEDDLCIKWMKIQNDTIIVKEGPLSINKIFDDSTKGEYLVDIYNCIDGDTIDESYFTIIDCDMPVEEMLSANELICDDKDRRIELNLIDSVNFVQNLEFKVWTYEEDTIGEKVSSGMIFRGKPSYIYYLLPGTYWLSVTNNAGYESGMPIEISDYQRLPREILYKENYELGDSALVLDASINIPFDALFEWSTGQQIVSNESIVTISQPGLYKINVTTNDCEKTDSVIVGGNPIEQRSMKKEGGIDLIFKNPSLLEESQKIYVVNNKIQEQTSLDIYSISGQLVLKKNFEHIKISQVKVNLVSGVYLIRAINSSGQIKIRKLVVQ